MMVNITWRFDLIVAVDWWWLMSSLSEDSKCTGLPLNRRFFGSAPSKIRFVRGSVCLSWLTGHHFRHIAGWKVVTFHNQQWITQRTRSTRFSTMCGMLDQPNRDLSACQQFPGAYHWQLLSYVLPSYIERSTTAGVWSWSPAWMPSSELSNHFLGHTTVTSRGEQSTIERHIQTPLVRIPNPDQLIRRRSCWAEPGLLSISLRRFELLRNRQAYQYYRRRHRGAAAPVLDELKSWNWPGATDLGKLTRMHGRWRNLWIHPLECID